MFALFMDFQKENSQKKLNLSNKVKSVNKTVLIVDDDPLLRLIVKRMMASIDKSLIFVECENGKVGLDKLSEHLSISSKCIILLDLNMPVLDGWGFLDVLQSSQLSASENIALYIFSSSTDKSDIERSRHYSCVRNFYHKPLSIDDIIEILNSKTIS